MNGISPFSSRLVALLLSATPLSAGFSSAFAQETEASALSPYFIKGKVYGYVSETDATIEFHPPSGPVVESKTSMKHLVALTIGERPGGANGVAIDASTDSFQLEISSGGRGLSYDSSDESNKDSDIAKHFGGALHRSVLIELDEGGKPVKATEHGGGGPATPLPGMPQIGPDQLKQIVLGLLEGFPREPVRPSDEWVFKNKRSFGEFGEKDSRFVYTYTDDQDLSGVICAVINYEGDVESDVAAAGVTPGSQGKEPTIDVTQLTGRLIFDKRGRAVQLKEETVKMNIDTPNSDPASNEMIRVSMEQKVHTRLTSVKDASPPGP